MGKAKWTEPLPGARVLWLTSGRLPSYPIARVSEAGGRFEWLAWPTDDGECEMPVGHGMERTVGEAKAAAEAAIRAHARRLLELVGEEP